MTIRYFEQYTSGWKREVDGSGVLDAWVNRLGQVEQAQALANLRLAEMVVNLQSELNYLLYGNKNGNNEEEVVAGESAGDAH